MNTKDEIPRRLGNWNYSHSKNTNQQLQNRRGAHDPGSQHTPTPISFRTRAPAGSRDQHGSGSQRRDPDADGEARHDQRARVQEVAAHRVGRATRTATHRSASTTSSTPTTPFLILLIATAAAATGRIRTAVIAAERPAHVQSEVEQREDGGEEHEVAGEAGHLPSLYFSCGVCCVGGRGPVVLQHERDGERDA
ncbi:hypothetical protein DL771_010258 [Monosporascus sp. 5C6A]|nr:hypothetical protein DL771_010258 [Monosporascus sp. 5C6A]